MASGELAARKRAGLPKFVVVVAARGDAAVDRHPVDAIPFGRSIPQISEETRRSVRRCNSQASTHSEFAPSLNYKD